MYRSVRVPVGTLARWSDGTTLLAAVVDHLAADGLGDLSLRAIAAAVGTSHRMLLYHFGSKDELLVAVVQHVEAEQREFARSLAESDREPAEQLRALWRQVSSRRLAPNARLFFQLYARGLAGEAAGVRLLDGDIERWLQVSGTDPVDARLASPWSEASCSTCWPPTSAAPSTGRSSGSSPSSRAATTPA